MAGNTLQLHKGDLRILYISMDPLIKTCTAERDIIITLIDSGICPDFRSGKIIGSRYYPSSEAGNYTTRDIKNHGTYTSSTTEGNEVKDGLGQGTARGGLPLARTVAHKPAPETDSLETRVLGSEKTIIVRIIVREPPPDSFVLASVTEQGIPAQELT
ncbi:hypothetical protein CUMW_176290, partial [Citrus unshiu]